MSDLRSLSSRLQTDQEPSPLPQGSRASDGYSTLPGGTEDDFSCMGECSGRRTFSGDGEATAPGGAGPSFHCRALTVNCTLSFGHT